MTEEFDEDVEFEYLQDLGLLDSETCWMVAGEEEGPLPQEGLAPLRGGVLQMVADAAWRLLSVHHGSLSLCEEQQLDVEFRWYSLRLLLEQDVFLQEDLELIELLDPSVLSVVSASTPPAAPPGNRLLPCAWDLWALAVLGAVLAGLWSVWEGRGPCSLLPWVLVLAVFLLARGAGLWRAARLRDTMRAHGAQLESLARDSRAFTALARKTLRLVQETEVISRGFTLVSAARPFSRAEEQLQELRSASHRTLRTAFTAYRHATRHMLSAYPLDSETDDAGHYLSAVPLGELGLGPGQGEGRLGERRGRELAEDCGLPALKVLFQLFVGQSSEFFRRLALLLSPGHQGGREPRLARRAVAEATGPLRLALRGCLGDLRHSYELRRCSKARRGGEAGSGRAERAGQRCRELGALHATVQSLQLHLRALLNEVIILEDELEKLLVSTETAEAACAEDLRDRLRLLQPHMQASRGCWEETVAQVGRVLRLSASRAGTPGTPEESVARGTPPPACPGPLPQDRQPTPEEQELEAYVWDSDSDWEWRDASCDPLTPEERKQRRRVKEDSRPALLELKSVLHLRPSDGERARRKQLLLRGQERTTLPMEPWETHGTPSAPEPYSQHNSHEDLSLSSTGAQFCCGRSEGGRAAPEPRPPKACGRGRTGGGGQQDRVPPGGHGVHAVCDERADQQPDGPPQHCSVVSPQHQRGGADPHG